MSLVKYTRAAWGVDFDYGVFDKLIDENISFALYRFPNDEHLHFAAQNDGYADCVKNIADISNHAGFVICPFIPSEKTPIVLIRPDIHLEGIEQIGDYVNQIISERAITKSADTAIAAASGFEAYQHDFEIFHTALKNGTLDKLVLSRAVECRRDAGFSIGQTFARGVEKYPNAFVYLCYTPQSGAWLGCSPELLLSCKNGEGRTMALAGTQQANKIHWDDKNRNEQEIVTKYIRRQLKSQNIDFAESKVQPATAGNVVHLKTEFVFQLSSQNKMGELLQALHPTPAVCGFPKERALSFITANESYDRRYYAGFTGTANMENNTSLYVNLRCMEVLANALKLYAGGGLLASSDVETEWRETEYKMQTILSIINSC